MVPVTERSAVRIDTEVQQQVPILVIEGVLDSSTYRKVRDTVIKAALDEPRVVIVDVERLSVPTGSAWTVFTSARWHVSIWPDAPILLVCPALKARRAIIAGGVTRYVPLYATRQSALEAVRGRSLQLRHRARTELPRAPASPGLARTVVTDWLTSWQYRELIPAASTVATVFVENVLDHTESTPILLAESYQDAVTIAVEDCSDRLPGRREDADRGPDTVSGLAVVSALCRTWGFTPTSTGKTVWGMLCRENHF